MTGRLIAAAALLALAGLFLLLARRAERRRRAMYLTETYDSATLTQLHRAATDAAGADAFSLRVDLEGTAAPGPEGLLSSPLTHTPCVWHRHQVTRRYEVEVQDAEGKERLETREEVISQSTSDTPLRVRDDSGLLDVEGTVPVDRPRVALDEFVPVEIEHSRAVQHGEPGPPAGHATGHTLGHRRQEWVLEPGTALYVSGEARDRAGRLVVGAPGDGTPLVVSTRSQEALLTSAQHGARTARWAAAASTVAAAGLALSALLR